MPILGSPLQCGTVIKQDPHLGFRYSEQSFEGSTQELGEDDGKDVDDHHHQEPGPRKEGPE